MKKSVSLASVLLGILAFCFTNVATPSKFNAGTYELDYGSIEQINLVRHGQGEFSIEIWPYKNNPYWPTGELGKAPLKYLGGPEAVEIATLLAARPNIIKGVSYDTTKIVAYKGRPSYISGWKQVLMYRVTSFFFSYPDLPPEEDLKSGGMIKGAAPAPGEPQGWCCAKGQIFPSLGNECARKGGILFSPNRQEVEQECSDVGLDAPTQPGRHPVTGGDPHQATPVTLPGPSGVRAPEPGPQAPPMYMPGPGTFRGMQPPPGVMPMQVPEQKYRGGMRQLPPEVRQVPAIVPMQRMEPEPIRPVPAQVMEMAPSPEMIRGEPIQMPEAERIR